MPTLIKGNILSIIKDTDLLVLPASSTIEDGSLLCTTPELAFFASKYPKLPIAFGSAIENHPNPSMYGFVLTANKRTGVLQVHNHPSQELVPILTTYALYQLANMANKMAKEGKRVDLLYPRSVVTDKEIKTYFNDALRTLLPDNVHVWSDYE